MSIKKKGEGDSERVCVCVCNRERERENEGQIYRERECDGERRGLTWREREGVIDNRYREDIYDCNMYCKTLMSFGYFSNVQRRIIKNETFYYTNC